MLCLGKIGVNSKRQWNVYLIKKLKWKKTFFLMVSIKEETSTKWHALIRRKDSHIWATFSLVIVTCFTCQVGQTLHDKCKAKEKIKKSPNAQCFSMALCTPLCYVWLHIEITRYYYEWLIWEFLVISVPVTICKNEWTAERLMCPTCCRSLVLVNCLVTVPPYDSLHTSLLWSSCVRSLGKHTLKANAPILCLNCKRWPFISKDDRFL